MNTLILRYIVWIAIVSFVFAIIFVLGLRKKTYAKMGCDTNSSCSHCSHKKSCSVK